MSDSIHWQPSRGATSSKADTVEPREQLRHWGSLHRHEGHDTSSRAAILDPRRCVEPSRPWLASPAQGSASKAKASDSRSAAGARLSNVGCLPTQPRLRRYISSDNNSPDRKPAARPFQRKQHPFRCTVLVDLIVSNGEAVQGSEVGLAQQCTSMQKSCAASTYRGRRAFLTRCTND